MAPWDDWNKVEDDEDDELQDLSVRGYNNDSNSYGVDKEAIAI
jgi:hypothetical protein